MDFDPPPIDDPEDDRAGAQPAFASASSQTKSRIADNLARQRRATARAAGPQLNPAKKPGNMASPKPRVVPGQAARANPKASIKKSTARQFDRTIDSVIDYMPSLQLTPGSITRMRWLVGTQSLVILGLALTLCISYFELQDSNVYGAMNNSKGAGATGAAVRPLPAMLAPIHTQQAVLSWASTTATEILSFGFHNAVQRLGSERKNFTDTGWKAFTDAITDSEIMQNIVQKEQVITAAPIGAPVIVKVTVMPDGNREWIVQIPFMVTILSGKKTEGSTRTLTLTIVRVSPEQNLTGLGIDNWVER